MDGACLGQEALIATVVRISLRYRRLSQLEEGYGLIMSPLEKLARTVYADDPAERFKARGTGLREDLLMAQMQKAVAIMQFKLEGQLSRRYPDWEMEHRNLLHRIDYDAGTVEIEGRVHPLRDTKFPQSIQPTLINFRPKNEPAWIGSSSRSLPAHPCGSTCCSWPGAAPCGCAAITR